MDDARIEAEIGQSGKFGDLVRVRKFVVHVEEVLHEFGPPLKHPS